MLNGLAAVGPPALRRHNLGLVLRELRTRGGASRADLAARTGLTRATVATLVEPLLAAGVLAEDAAVARGVGRPARAVRFAPDGPVALGVAVDVDSLAACAVGLDGTVRARERIARDHRDLSPAAVADGAAALAQQVLAAAGSARRDPAGRGSALALGVGLALPALLGDAAVPARFRTTGQPRDGGATAPRARPDSASPVVLRAPNLPLLTGARAGDDLAARLGLPVTVGNEATLGALAHLDLAPDLVYVSGGVGVGGGIVLGGRVHRGTHGLAGEIGHVVVDRDGPPCGCGARGCVETYAGTAALLTDAGSADVAALEAALTRGEERALTAVGRAASALGVGLASVLHVLDLPVIVLGGTLARLAVALVPPLEAELARRTLAPAPARVLASRRGEDAAVLGAAEAVLAAVAADPDRLLPPDRTAAP